MINKHQSIPEKDPVLNQPYPGLRPFQKHESEIFCGREKQINELIKRLNRNRFIAIVGPSGSGKSSLINAGLIPKIENDSFKIIEVRPKFSPMQSLVEGLYHRFKTDSTFDEIKHTLLSSFFGLIDYLETKKDIGDKFLLVIDQFEEIFRYIPQADEDNEAANFVYLLEESILQTEIPLYIIISMRSDNIGDCMKFYDLSELITNNIFLIPKLYRKQYREIITGPLSHKLFCNKAIITDELTNKLLNDLSDRKDQLPILQHALWRMWNQQKGTEKIALNNKLYNDIGELSGCLNNDADKQFNHLNHHEQRICQKLFKCLINAESYREDVRRPMVDINTISNETAENINDIIKIIHKFSNDDYFFIKKFQQDRLILSIKTTEIENDNAVMVEICHESIIRQWKKLNAWMFEEIDNRKCFEFILEKILHLRLQNLKHRIKSKSKSKSDNLFNDDKRNTYFLLKTNYLTDDDRQLLRTTFNISDSAKLSSDQLCNTVHFTDKDKLDDYILLKAKQWKNDKMPNKYWARRYNQTTTDNAIKDTLFNDVEAFIQHNLRLQIKERNFKKRLTMSAIVVLLIIVFGLSLLSYKNQKFLELSFDYCLLQSTINIKLNKYCEADTLLKKTNDIYTKVGISKQFSKDLLQWHINAITIQPMRENKIHLKNCAITSQCCLLSDRNTLIAGTNTGQILWIDMKKNKIVKRKKAHKKSIIQLAASNDNQWFISVTSNGVIRQWTAENSDLINEWDYVKDKATLDPIDTQLFDGYDNKQSSVVFANDKSASFLFSMSDDAQYIAYGSNSAIIIRDIQHNKMVVKSPIYAESSINDIALSHINGHLALAIADSNYLYLWEDGNKTLYSQTVDPIRDIVFSNNDELFGITSQHVFRFNNNFAYEISHLFDEITQLFVDRNNNLLAVTQEKNIAVINDKNDYYKTFDKHLFPITGIIETKNNFISIDSQGGIKTWTPDAQLWHRKSLKTSISSIALSADTNKLFVAGTNGSLNTLFSQKLQIINEQAFENSIEKIVISKDNARIALIMDKKIMVVDHNGQLLFQIKDKNFEQISMVPYKNELLMLHHDGTITLFTKEFRKTLPIKKLNLDIFSERMIAWDIHPDGTQLIVGSSSGYLYIVSYPELNVIQSTQMTTDSLKHVAYDKTGKRILVINNKDEIALINQKALKRIVRLKFIDHQDKMLTAGLIHGNKHIVSVDQGRKIHFWDLSSKSELFHINLPVEPVRDRDPVVDFVYHCDSYQHCIFTVALINNTLVQYLYNADFFEK